MHIQRLKDKLGNRSNSSPELEFREAHTWMVGAEGEGVPTIIEMVNGTRLDCVSGSAGLMRQAVAQAAWHATHRAAFGSKLIDKPLMRNVLADLEIEVQAATLMMIRLAGAFERSRGDESEQTFRRIATPVAKYWVTKRCTPVVREAMECLGGNGYVEESILPRLLCESPLNAIWEGSGNVIVLDVLRSISRQPRAVETFHHELEEARGHDRAVDASLDGLHDLLTGPDPERNARRTAEATRSDLGGGATFPGRPRGGRYGLYRHPGGRGGRSPLRHPPARHRRGPPRPPGRARGRVTDARWAGGARGR